VVTRFRRCPRCGHEHDKWLLDLCCCQGGGATGYHRAGFGIVGVDIEPQPRYPFEFHQADAMTFPLEGFDAIHASPPCQFFTQMNGAHRARHVLGQGRPVLDLLTPMLTRLRGLEVPWVVENVVGAGRAVGNPTLKLHGGMFGLPLYRPRVFWSNVLILSSTGPIVRQPVGVWGDRPQVKRRTRLNGDQRGKRSIMWQAQSVEEAREAMDMPWADWHGCKEAIPPAYTEFIGAQLIDYVTAGRAAC
jgi:DNA (cytosine-5)-methyltransferase 1